MNPTPANCTFAIFLGNRGFFPSSCIAAARAEMLAARSAAGHRGLCPPEDGLRHGAVETAAEGRAWAAWFAANKAQFDGVILCLPNFGVSPFSSVMYDASTLPLAAICAATARFVARRGREIVVEGACDEIIDAGGSEDSPLSSVPQAEAFARTGVDLMVANLGTAHRASAATLRYHGDLARQISRVVGPRLLLHGASSVAPAQVLGLFRDGVVKCNIWTALERDSSPALLAELARHAGKAAGASAQALREAGVLGPASAVDERAALSHCTTAARQHIIYDGMKAIATRYLAQWYLASAAQVA